MKDFIRVDSRVLNIILSKTSHEKSKFDGKVVFKTPKGHLFAFKDKNKKYALKGLVDLTLEYIDNGYDSQVIITT